MIISRSIYYLIIALDSIALLLIVAVSIDELFVDGYWIHLKFLGQIM